MYTTVQFLHSYWAYLTVLIVLLASLNAIFGSLSKREYAPKDFRISLFALIVTHIQFLLGVILYFISPLGMKNISNSGMSAIMENSEFRLHAIEHPIIMILVVVLITLGYKKHKNKLVSNKKFNALAVFYTLGLVLMLSRIPWDQWLDF